MTSHAAEVNAINFDQTFCAQASVHRTRDITNQPGVLQPHIMQRIKAA